jgi:hypothetical protein
LSARTGRKPSSGEAAAPKPAETVEVQGDPPAKGDKGKFMNLYCSEISAEAARAAQPPQTENPFGKPPEGVLR